MHDLGSVPETTSDEVVALFCRTPRARATYETWCRRPEGGAVVKLVTAHRTSAPYRITSDQIAQTCRDTTHALGEIRKAEAEAVPMIADWRPDFAITHVLHYALERAGQPFTWQWFLEFFQTDTAAAEMLHRPGREKVQQVIAAGAAPATAKAAMTWRIGNCYYSFLRELYTVVQLRERGIDIRVHPLADALFRVDAWCGPLTIDIYIGNSRYRDRSLGRKIPAQRITGLPSHSLRLDAPREFGRVRLPDAEALDLAAVELRASMAHDDAGRVQDR